MDTRVTLPMTVYLISAHDLKRRNKITTMRAYAVVWVKGLGRRTEYRTTVDRVNGENPRWNHLMFFSVDEGSLQQDLLELEVVVWHESAFGDKEIGRATIPLREFAPQNLNEAGNGVDVFTYDILKHSGKVKGKLNVSIRMGDQGDTQHPQYNPFPGGYPPQQGHVPPPVAPTQQNTAGMGWIGPVLSAAAIGTNILNGVDGFEGLTF